MAQIIPLDMATKTDITQLRNSNFESGASLIAVVGGINMDLVYEVERMPVAGESVDTTSLTLLPGGKGANTAMAVYRASHSRPNSEEPNSGSPGDDIRVFMNGAVGCDAFGQTLVTNLRDTGIDVCGVLTVKGNSGTCTVIVETDLSESRNLGYEGANLLWAPIKDTGVECLAGDTGRKPDLIIAHLGTPRRVIEPLLERAHSNGVDTLLNPAPAYRLLDQTYSYVTHLILNETETATLTGINIDDLRNPAKRAEAASHFIELGVKNVVLTLGSQGAYYCTKSGEKGLVLAVPNVVVKDTTGAGDSFVGAYAVHNMRQKQQGKWDIEKAIEFACKAAAHTVRQLGAQEALPWSDQIEDA